MRARPPRIDAHQHFWRRQRGDYGWLREDDDTLAPLCRDFDPAELAPLLAAHGVVQTVLVQAAPTAAETDFLLDLADEHAFVGGVVGWVDLEAPDAAEQLAQRSTEPKFRGLRPMLQDLPDPAWITRHAPLAALRQAQELGLRFDALVTPAQLPAMAQALRVLPGLPTVVDHAAKPRLGDAVAMAAWARDLRAIAGLPMTLCKLSGLLTQLPAPATGNAAVDAAALRPVFDTLLDAFGPARLIWGSDWPVLTLAGTYAHWCDVSEVLLGELSATEQAQIWAGNARRFYDLNRPA